MVDFAKDPMAAGFGEAVKSRTDDRSDDGDVTRVRRRRLRGSLRTEARDPAAAKVIESNALRVVVDRLVRLETEKSEIVDSIKAEYASAKESGYEVKSLRIVIKRKMEDEDKRIVREAVELTAAQMMAALGMLASTPLGKAAIESAAP